MSQNKSDAAIEAIKFAIKTDDGITFLDLWLHGDFDAIRKEWPECPATVFVGADSALSLPGVYIDLAQHKNPKEALSRALRGDPAKIIFIGSSPELEKLATDCGHEVVVLPIGSEIPVGASAVMPLPI